MISVEQFAEFSAALTNQLPKILSEADPDAIQHLIENPGDLYRLIEQPVLSYQRPSNFYVVDVDYGEKIEKALKKTQLNSFWYDMEAKEWDRTSRKGKARIEIALLRFNDKSYLEPEEIFSRLSKMKFRPAEVIELIALSAQHPDLQKQHRIAAFGTIVQKKESYREITNPVVSYLYAEKKKGSDDHWIVIHWHRISGLGENRFYTDSFVFAAVRDRSIPPMNSP